eukprot:840172_1
MDDHGTNVAAIIGSKTFGVAKNVNLNSIDLGGVTYGEWRATSASIIEAFLVVAAQPGRREKKVVNVSLGSRSPMPILTSAADALVGLGIVVVVAAGNSSEVVDECTSPADAKKVITVAST